MDTISVTNRHKLHVLLAVMFVAVCAVIIETNFGVGVEATVRFAIFEAVYVLLPGWMLYVALSANSGGLVRQVALGAGVGYALEAFAFAATSVAGFPTWFAAYPAVVGIVALPILWFRRRRSGFPKFALPSPRPIWSWALAIICVAALVYLALAYFVTTPLPHQTESVSYYADTVWDISCAAEAKHHWPITDPRMAGEPFYYYTFVFMHMAAASRLTGLDLPLIVFRLYIVSFFLVFALQLYVAGREMGSSRLAGLLSVVITLFIGSLQLWPLKISTPFLNVFYPDLSLSPTFLLGLLLFTPLVIEMYDRLKAPNQRGSVGSWLLIVSLLVASGGAKGTVLPVVAGGLGVYVIWRLFWDRTLDWPAVTGGALALVVFAAWSKLVYSQSRISPTFHPLASISLMPFFTKYFPFVKKTTLWARFWLLIVTPFALAAMAGVRALTTGWILCGGDSRRNRAQMWLLSLFAISVVPFLVLNDSDVGQLYFLLYGFAALNISAACALCTMLEESGGWPRPRKLALFGSVAILFVNGLFDTPKNYYGDLRKRFFGKGNHARVGEKCDLTKSLFTGLEWLRLNSSTKDILAVNIHYSLSSRPRYFYYSAFAERRVFLEGWAYSRIYDRSDRFALNERLFEKTDPEALRLMVEKYGVTYLVVDKVHGLDNPSLSTLARLVFSNPDVTIYAVHPDLLHQPPSANP